MSVDSKMTAIADAIRDKTGGTEKLNLDDMAAGIGDVFNAGYAAGQATGGGGDTEAAYDEGFADGKQAGTEEMWDNLQNYGNRTDYRYAFFHSGSSQIDPKYDVNATNAEGIMHFASNLETVNWSKFDLSSVSTLYNAFSFSPKLKRIDTVLGIINGTLTLMNSVCRQCSALTSIQKVVSAPVYVWKNSFDYCTALTHVIFDGTIGANGLNLKWSTGLDRESIESIINALSDTTSGLSITLSETAVINAFGNLTDEWTTVAGSKLNWTINLV